MFNSFVEFLLGFIGFFRFWIIIDEYERGIVLRLGRFNRELDPGFHLKFFGFEEEMTVTTSICTADLGPQTLTTKDNVSVVVIAIIKYQIKNVKPYFLEVNKTKDVLCDVAKGAVKDVIYSSNFDDLSLNSAKLESDVLNLVRREVNPYGFKIHKVTFSTLGKIKTLRLIQDYADSSDDDDE